MQTSHDYYICTLYTRVASRAGFFGSGSGLKLTKISGLCWAWYVLFVLGAQKYNQNNLATLLNFSDLIKLSGFFGHDLIFKLVFVFGMDSGLYFRVRAGFGPELVGPFTTLLYTVQCFLYHEHVKITTVYAKRLLCETLFFTPIYFWSRWVFCFVLDFVRMQVSNYEKFQFC